MRFLALLLLAACASHQIPKPVAHPGPRSTVRVAMSDGVELFTHVYLPRGDGPWPVILMRAPYPMGPVLGPRCKRFNEQGYACVWQMARGRGKSDGEWLPFENEVGDGLDALAWITAQPWCDGNIGMMGESYLGASTWAVAHDPPPALKTIVPLVIGTDLYGAAYEGGLFRHDILTAWMSLMPADHTFRMLSGSRRYHAALKTRPRSQMDEVAAKQTVPWFDHWVEASDPAHPFWNRPIVRGALETPAVTPLPVLSIGGWSDAFLGPQLETWQQLGNKADSHWIIGPWNHLTMVPAAVDQDGIKTPPYRRLYQEWPILLDWFGHHLKGEPLDVPAGRVSAYVVNGGGWVSHPVWPPPTTPRTWHIARTEGADRCEGTLAEAPGGQGQVQFTYDPDDPTPSRGGAGVLAGAFPFWRGAEPGFLDQGRLCQRRDDLVGFATEPFPEAVHVAGTLKATVRFASDAPDTAVNVRFLEERKGGRRIHVRETILALSHRDGHGQATYTPGEPITVELETWPVEYVFEAGSRLLVQLASASFPKYEAHANLTGPWHTVQTPQPAHQTLHAEGTHITLPVLGSGR